MKLGTRGDYKKQYLHGTRPIIIISLLGIYGIDVTK